jgi:hypothetical protein
MPDVDVEIIQSIGNHIRRANGSLGRFRRHAGVAARPTTTRRQLLDVIDGARREHARSVARRNAGDFAAGARGEAADRGFAPALVVCAVPRGELAISSELVCGPRRIPNTEEPECRGSCRRSA